MKIVYQTDKDGFLIGAVPADESPLEPGVYLIPGGAVETRPPDLKPGRAARWVNGAWEVTIAAPKTTAMAEEGQPDPDLAATIRSLRNQRLAASDWTQLPDAPTDHAAWASYRQALRDVPQQPAFPESVVWPDPPA